ncbi:hypothetical protein F4809DRAFT_607289 [Biscogniauxia mediterranea]|nr:hypothetical protein F4809DRAFT_607289 [Biscogniauxia mediterranea]
MSCPSRPLPPSDLGTTGCGDWNGPRYRFLHISPSDSLFKKRVFFFSVEAPRRMCSHSIGMMQGDLTFFLFLFISPPSPRFLICTSGLHFTTV